jgi:hypothetical protein
MLKGFLSHPYDLPDDSSVKSINSELSSDKRTGNIFNNEGGAILDSKITIFDVRLDDPEQYCQDVIAWARAVVEVA